MLSGLNAGNQVASRENHALAWFCFNAVRLERRKSGRAPIAAVAAVVGASMLYGLNAGNQGTRHAPHVTHWQTASMLSGLNAGNQDAWRMDAFLIPSRFNAVRLERRKSGGAVRSPRAWRLRSFNAVRLERRKSGRSRHPSWLARPASMLSGLNAGNQGRRDGSQEHGHRKASMLSGLNAGNQDGSLGMGAPDVSTLQCCPA